MFVFTIGGVLDSFFAGSQQNAGPIRQVATTSFGNFTNRDMENFAEGNRRVAEFTFELYRLSGDITKAKAVPISPLNSSTNEARDRDILSRLAFAEFAKEKGMYVGEEILNDYFNMLCNNELGNQGKTVEEFSRELQRGALSEVKSHLKTELLARCGQQMANAGINAQYGQQGFILDISKTPLEIWEGNRRLRERFKIEYMAMDVEPVSSISEEPSADEMQALYEEGMDRAPNIAIGPGFKKPRLATVSYFALNRKNFMEAEKKKITEEQVLTKYNEWVENEDFRVVDSDSSVAGGGAFQPKKDGDDAGAKKDDSKADDVAPGLNSPENNKDDKSGEPAKSNDEGEKTDDKAPKQNATGEKAVDKPEAAKGESKEDDGQKKSQSSLERIDGAQFVSLIQEETKQEAPKKEEAAQPKQKKKSEEKTETPKKSEQSDVPKKDDAKQANDAEKTETPQKGSVDTEDPKKSTTPDSVPPKAVQDDKEKDKPKIRPLDDELRDTIKEELARPIATEAMAKALEDAKAVVSEYLNDYDYYADNPEEADYFETPDFATIAGDNGLQFKTFEQVDFQSLIKTDFGKATVAPSSTRQRPGSVAFEIFAATFYSGSSFEIYTTQAADDVEYMFWVTDKKFREKVSFAEAKPKIIEYYKMTKAIEAAEAKAKSIAEEVAGENKTLSASKYADQVQTSREFGWMEIAPGMEDMAARNPQFIQQFPQLFAPKLGSIFPDNDDEEAKSLESIDHTFMSKVFNLEKNEIGYSTDATKEKVYVFQVIERTKANPIEKDQFFTQNKFGTAQQVSQLDQGMELNKILSAEALLEKYSVKWFGEQENKE